MKKYKILNLYACLGGNRAKWDEVAKEASIEIEVTSVELDPELAILYQERFPNDIVIVADAHQYLLDHYKEFDFIWSSPPCPTHSKSRFARRETTTPEYPDMKLYQEILFLDNWLVVYDVVEGAKEIKKLNNEFVRIYNNTSQPFKIEIQPGQKVEIRYLKNDSKQR